MVILATVMEVGLLAPVLVNLMISPLILHGLGLMQIPF